MFASNFKWLDIFRSIWPVEQINNNFCLKEKSFCLKELAMKNHVRCITISYTLSSCCTQNILSHCFQKLLFFNKSIYIFKYHKLIINKHNYVFEESNNFKGYLNYTLAWAKLALSYRDQIIWYFKKKVSYWVMRGCRDLLHIISNFSVTYII